MYGIPMGVFVTDVCVILLLLLLAAGFSIYQMYRRSSLKK